MPGVFQELSQRSTAGIRPGRAVSGPAGCRVRSAHRTSAMPACNAAESVSENAASSAASVRNVRRETHGVRRAAAVGQDRCRRGLDCQPRIACQCGDVIPGDGLTGAQEPQHGTANRKGASARPVRETGERQKQRHDASQRLDVRIVDLAPLHRPLASCAHYRAEARGRGQKCERFVADCEKHNGFVARRSRIDPSRARQTDQISVSPNSVSNRFQCRSAPVSS